MNWLGLDIGGANLKAADGRGWARSVPFALWREPERLATALAELVEIAPCVDAIAVTMTGELCDCFRTKAEGVKHILLAAESASDGRPVHVYTVDGAFMTTVEAGEKPHLAAASNWHALATFACRYVSGDELGLLIDIGSTTSDFIPLASNRPLATRMSDTARLLAGELVYTGVGRTPVCAAVRSVRWRSQECPVAAELFATTADAYVILRLIEEQADATWTADGRPLTRTLSSERLARMICADRTTFDLEDACDMAGQIRDAQLESLRTAVRKVCQNQVQPIQVVVTCGAGEFLARVLIQETLPDAGVLSLRQELGGEVSDCAPAHAVAVLASERSIAT